MRLGLLILLVGYRTLADQPRLSIISGFHGVHVSFARRGQRFRPSASPRAALVHRYTLLCCPEDTAQGVVAVVARVVTTRRAEHGLECRASRRGRGSRCIRPDALRRAGLLDLVRERNVTAVYYAYIIAKLARRAIGACLSGSQRARRATCPRRRKR